MPEMWVSHRLLTGNEKLRGVGGTGDNYGHVDMYQICTVHCCTGRLPEHTITITRLETTLPHLNQSHHTARIYLIKISTTQKECNIGTLITKAMFVNPGSVSSRNIVKIKTVLKGERAEREIGVTEKHWRQ